MAIDALSEWNANHWEAQMGTEVEHARDVESLPEVKEHLDRVLAGSPLP